MSSIASILCFFGQIYFILTQDLTGQQNDIIPNQSLEIPQGEFCYFTCNKLMFENYMQQVAPNSYRVSAGRLTNAKIISSASSMTYDNIWCAVYFVPQEEYQNIISYATFENTVAFVSTVQVETVDNKSAQCVTTDFGLQANSYPYTQSCDRCNAGYTNGAPTQPNMQDYNNELMQMGIPAAYIQQISQLPTMQNPSASAKGGGQQQQSTSGNNNGGNGQPTNTGYLPSAGLPSQAQATSNSQQLSQEAQPASTGNGDRDNGLVETGSGNQAPHQLQNSNQSLYGTSPDYITQTSQGYAPYDSPSAYAPFDNQFVQPTRSLSSNQYQPSSMIGMNSSSSYGTYQPQYKFPNTPSTGGNSPQPRYIPGFTVACLSPEYSYLKPTYGMTFVDYEATISRTMTYTGVGVTTGM